MGTQNILIDTGVSINVTKQCEIHPIRPYYQNKASGK